jgi:mannitol repressor
MTQDSKADSKAVDPVELARHQEIAKSLLKESDRGCAMIAGAILDEHLEEMLRGHFRKHERIDRVTDTLFAGVGPLSSFWAKIQIAYALGLIGHKTYSTLEWIRSIRNEFAHEYGPRSFNDEKIKPGIDALIGAGPPRPEDIEVMPVVGGNRGDFIRRLAFVLSVAGLGGRMMSVRDVLLKGGDPRPLVRSMEERGEW